MRSLHSAGWLHGCCMVARAARLHGLCRALRLLWACIVAGLQGCRQSDALCGLLQAGCGLCQSYVTYPAAAVRLRRALSDVQLSVMLCWSHSMASYCWWEVAR